MKKLDSNLLNKKIEQRFNDDVNNDVIACGAALVTQNGETLVDIKKEVQPRALFRLASMSKPITAFATLIQIEKGKLALTDNISKYLPDFKEMYVGSLSENKVVKEKKADKEIQVINLLTHTSGILSDMVGIVQENNIPAADRVNLKTMVDYYSKNICLSFNPMEKALYSGTGAFNVLSRIIEITADMPFGDFLSKYVFTPLEMVDTTFAPTEEQWQRVVPMHNRANKNIDYMDANRTTFESLPVTLHSGAANLAGTIEDYSHFAKCLLQNGSYNNQQIVSEALIKEMKTPQLPEVFPGTGIEETWGLGVRVIKKSPVMETGAFGWSGAYGTHFFVDPANQITAIYMKNSRLTADPAHRQQGILSRISTAALFKPIILILRERFTYVS